MVLVVNVLGEFVYLLIYLFNWFGYDIEFDKDGRFDEWWIDYEVMVVYIVVLYKVFVKCGYDVWWVIFVLEF